MAKLGWKAWTTLASQCSCQNSAEDMLPLGEPHSDLPGALDAVDCLVLLPAPACSRYAWPTEVTLLTATFSDCKRNKETQLSPNLAIAQRTATVRSPPSCSCGMIFCT